MALKKVISFLFIALVLTNLGHIPHHHHLSGFHAPEGCSQHDCDLKDPAAGKSCTHCEAFNGMEYYPISNPIKIESPKRAGSVFFILSGSLPDPEAARSVEVIAFAVLADPYRGLAPEIISLRGPPSC